MATTFVHLTDPHISVTDPHPLMGIDTMQKLRDALTMLRERGVLPATPMIFTGDLAEGEPESYVRFRAVVEELRAGGTTVHLALGNHDNRANFRTIMLDEATNDGSEKYYYTAMLGGLRLIVLDSLERGTHAGVFGAAQLDWLRGELATPALEGTVIAVHHPPPPPPLPAQKNLMLTDADTAALREAIVGTDVIGLLHGHTHVAQVVLFGGVPSITAPGTQALNDITFTAGWRRVEGGGINLITVRDRVMTVKQIALPGSQRELWRRVPNEATQISAEPRTTVAAH